MQSVVRIVRSIFKEILIIFLLIFVINNYIGNVNVTINADAIGYYDYLPSIFIHHDLVRYNADQNNAPAKYERINPLGVYLSYKNFKVNRYLCGTAILESPFFFITCLSQGASADSHSGYERPYQRAIFYAAIFYLFLTIFLLKKLLEFYNLKGSTIVFVQLLLVLGTSVTDYVNYEAGFSHVYSLAAITAFIYFAKKYLLGRKYSDFLFTSALLGLIILIRPVNGIIVFIIPFLAGSFPKLREEFVFLFKKPLRIAAGILVILLIVSIQSMLWYLQTGEFLLYTYGDVGFDFLKPELVNVLFSYRKGLFVYTPVLMLAMTALIWLAVKRRYYELLTWLLIFFAATYVISSWKCWYYGGSFGLRAFIDYYAVFFLVFAIMFDKLSVWLKAIFVIPALFMIYMNIVQTYQFKEFILNYSEMNKEKYWTVFLKTDDKFKGLLWKKNYFYQYYLVTDEISIGDFSIPAETDSVILKVSTIGFKDIEKIKFFQVQLKYDFPVKNDSRIYFSIRDVKKDSLVCYADPYLLHFQESGFNKYQTGLYNFEPPLTLTNGEYEIKIVASSRSGKLDLHDVRLKAYKPI